MNPCPKPEPRRKVKARAKRQHAQDRADCRRVVWERDWGRCVVCRRALTLDEAHIHEVVYRSRGGSDTDPANCVTCCYACHADVHCGKVSIGGRR